MARSKKDGRGGKKKAHKAKGPPCFRMVAGPCSPEQEEVNKRYVAKMQNGWKTPPGSDEEPLVPSGVDVVQPTAGAELAPKQVTPEKDNK